MKKILIAVALASALGAAQARTTIPLIEQSRISVVSPKPIGAAKLKQAIARGGARHNWMVVGDVPGKMTLKYIKQGKHEVVVDVSYDDTSFQIAYVSSVNMKYEMEGGKPMIHPFYAKWTENLSRAITVETNQLAVGM